jgi:hypothetical protein
MFCGVNKQGERMNIFPTTLRTAASSGHVEGGGVTSTLGVAPDAPHEQQMMDSRWAAHWDSINDTSSSRLPRGLHSGNIRTRHAKRKGTQTTSNHSKSRKISIDLRAAGPGRRLLLYSHPFVCTTHIRTTIMFRTRVSSSSRLEAVTEGCTT